MFRIEDDGVSLEILSEAERDETFQVLTTDLS